MSSKKEAEKSGDHGKKQDADLQEDEAEVQKALSCLRTLLSEENNLKVRTDDKFLLRYLRANDFNPQGAFDKMVKFYKLKLRYEDYFCSASPSDLKHLFAQNFLHILDDRDQKGRRIIWYKMKNVDMNTVYFADCSKLFDLWAELILEEDETQKAGMVGLIDMEGLPWKAIQHLTPRAVYINSAKEEARSWKSREFHIVNASRVLNSLYNIVNPLLGQSFKQRIHLYERNWEDLHKFIDPKALPQEYGGSKCVDYDTMKDYLFRNEDKIKELLAMGYSKT